MDIASVLRRYPQRLVASSGRKDLVARSLEGSDDVPSHRFLILDHQDGFGPRGLIHDRSQAGRGQFDRELAREEDLEGGAQAELAVHPDTAAALLDDAVDRKSTRLN